MLLRLDAHTKPLNILFGNAGLYLFLKPIYKLFLPPSRRNYRFSFSFLDRRRWISSLRIIFGFPEWDMAYRTRNFGARFPVFCHVAPEMIFPAHLSIPKQLARVFFKSSAIGHLQTSNRILHLRHSFRWGKSSYENCIYVWPAYLWRILSIQRHQPSQRMQGAG